jgi:ATP-binding cassette subfamily B protein
VLTAVVGRSGSGKSTIMQLVARLRTPLSGAVTLGETPIGAIANGELREKVGVVSQFAPILTDTVRANFQLLKANATDAEIEAVSRRTGFWDVLLRKDPEKPLDQPMQREVGRGFSGGERRLLAITRLLLRDPEIILFDEPTTGIDAQSLEPVKAAMLAAAKDRTAILVEHDLALVRALADEVCVLENGRFVQVGPPAKLAAEPGPFRDLLDARERLVATEAAMTIESFPVPQLPPKGGPAPGMAKAGSPPPGVSAGAPKIAPGTMKKGFAP